MAALATIQDPETPVGKALAKMDAVADAEAAKTLSDELIAAIKGPDKWPQKTKTLFQSIPYVISRTGEHPILVALHTIKGLADSMGNVAEPYLASALPMALANASHKSKAVQEAASACATSLITLLYPALNFVLPSIFEAMQQEKHWGTRVCAMSLFAVCAEKGKQQLKFCLPQIIPELTPCMTDTKKEVKKAAKAAMSAILSVAGNSDIEPVLEDLVSCIMKPKLVPELMHKLGGVVFVQTIDSAGLAVMVPLLVRGLRESQTAVKRTTCVIIENMSKLVENPIEAAPFLPLLLPALQKAADSVSDPEARAVADRALAQLTRLQNEIAKVGDVGKTDVALVEKIVREGLKLGTKELDGAFQMSLTYLCSILGNMIDCSVRSKDTWATVIPPYLTSFLEKDVISAGVVEITTNCVELIKAIPEEEEEVDDKEILADVEFTLAYGTKILLHNTKLKLKRGNRYGLLGPNDCGKTTLMRSISEGQIEGFPPPTELRTVFVEADILGELSHLTCTDYVLADPRIQSDGITREQVREALLTNHFNEKMLDDGVSTLSGGWRMKLALSRAMLLKADILLMDEPTNHLDVMNVKWVKDYLMSLTHVTSIMVSHDSGLLDDVCTHIIQIENLKLHMHPGNLSAFVAKVPEAKSYFEISASKQTFKFPQPGPLEGVKSKGKALMKMEGVSYMYPINKHYTITGITVQVSLSSRVGCVGPNGAGKSTMIKCLTGEVEPTVGTRWAHPSLRMAYVAQHAFHHIEQHLNKTPNEYIRWRYQNGDDKEAMNKITLKLSDEEEKLVSTPFEYLWKDENEKQHKEMRRVEKLTMMRRNIKGSKEFEYEVKWVNKNQDDNTYLSYSRLKKQGFEKWMMMVDQKIAARAGMYVRALTTANVEKHLEDVGLDREYGTHFRMNALSGGQKVKVVIGAAMWNQPHVVILDEPTNYLDRDSLGALANAIIEYEGGVVIITHNDEFCRTICPERWVLEKMGDGIGRLDCQGDPEWMTNALNTKIEFTQAEEMTDAAGNVTKVKQEKKAMSRKEEKAYKKRLQAKIKNNEPLESDEEDWAINNGLRD
jgi:elongation factor 3